MKHFQSFASKMIVVLLSIFIVLGTQSCKDKSREAIKIDPAFAAYIVSFTSGVVSNNTKVRVRLVQEVIDAVPGQPLTFNPFSFSPNIKGKALWVDKQTIEFTPEKRLIPGEVYTVDFELSKFIDVPENLKTLTFQFHVMKQAVQYEFNGIEPYKEMEKKWQKVHGIFITADFADASEFEKTVKAEGDGKTFSCSWIHSKDGRMHSFTIENVERKSKPIMIKVSCNAKDIGAEESTKERIEMPALDDFKVIHVKTKTNPNAAIEVFFSDPLNKSQDMNGLFIFDPEINESLVIKGNVAYIFPGRSVTGDVKLRVLASVKNVFENSLRKDFVKIVKFVSMKPQVQLIGEGNIIPNANGVMFPFKAVSLTAVDVKIIQIFENNIPQFLQVNQLDGNRELKRVGRIVYNEEVSLTSDKPIDYGMWNIFSLDLSKLIDPEPGAIYRVEISFRKKHSLYACSEKDNEQPEESFEPQKDINAAYDEPSDSYWDYYGDDDYYDDYNWYDRDNPCKNSYYMNSDNKVVRNVLASNFGIIAKAGTNSIYNVVITDLTTTEPLEDVEVEFRNYQNQLIAVSKTNSDGMCAVKTQNKPFLLIAKDGKQRGYLRLDDASSLSVSMFDVQGEELQKGVKGFIYGERGVWRPGDSLFITFILEDKNKSLPENHPVIFELYNPQSQLVQRIVKTTNVNGFYSFKTKTSDDSPTGNWLAKVKVGGSIFTQTLRIETVKPNRMKIQLNFASKILRNGVNETGKLQINWLHGFPAKNAKVVIDATIAPAKTEFDAFKGYVFDDPSKSFETRDLKVFEGNVNEEGSAIVNTKLAIENNTPGMVAVQMKTRAYESGGDFSSDRFVIKYSPYSSYVGLKIPEGKGWNNALYSNEKNVIPIVLVDEVGKPLSRKLKVEIFNVYWRWWWDQSDEENLADYVSNSYTNLLKTDYVTTKNGKVMYEMNLGGEYWGRKFIRVTDPVSGHSTGTVFYTTYKGWWSNAGSENPGGAEMLMISTAKKEYTVGEKVTVDLPVSHSGRALVSIETGSKVLQNFWVKAEKGNSKFTFTATSDMAPNIYIHVSFIQPHNHDKNDFPIRMYGVQSIKIQDPATHLSPVITMNKVLKPEEKFTVKVKESHGKPMTYTIAIVDEGLLDLTRFKTPNPWDAFYAHEALGVRTWDLYKYVAGAFTGKVAGLLAIGGDEALNKKGKENTNRFKPVVIFKGPYTCKAGEVKSHTFTMPNYVGSIKVMVIAGNEGAYGVAEQIAPVKQALMVLPTLPRVVSPTEVIRIPVTVFAMEKNIKNVTVNLKLDANFEALDGTSRQVIFPKEGEKTIEFKVRVKDRVAKGKILVTATSGTIQAKSETNLQIRMPNPPSIDVITAIIKPGATWTQKVKAIGIYGTNSGMIEVSKIFPINLEQRLEYLIQYPHGCIEQITSAAFPQLFLQNMMELTPTRKIEVETNVKACLQRLKSYQLSNGGFSYWPGETDNPSDWGTNYAGHFMLEAQARGYQIPVGILDNWISHQSTEANNWRYSSYAYYGSDINQAYRLYTLALAKKPAMSAMNRLRETSEISVEAKWRLAAAYAIAGKVDIASKIIETIGKQSNALHDYDYTYGSYERDQAMILETLVLLKKYLQAKQIADELSKTLSTNSWLSTQTTSYMLLSISKFIGISPQGKNLQAIITIDGLKTPVNSLKSMYQVPLNFSKTVTKEISITNNSKQIMYLRIQLQGIPLMNSQPANSENLSMTVKYFDMKGNLLNPGKINQGTDFYAEVSVSHPGIRMEYKDLAIQQLFPSGWEIINTRMDDIENSLITSVPRYQDIRDDRVYSYFDLEKSEKRVFRVLLHAAYLGTFYLPSVYCEAMYDNTIHARTPGQWVEVIR